MERNAFIVATASLVSLLVPTRSAADVLPPIYANGVDDDSPGIQWRLDRGMAVHIEGKTLFLRAPIRLTSRSASLSLKGVLIRTAFDDNNVLVNGVLSSGAT